MVEKSRLETMGITKIETTIGPAYATKIMDILIHDQDEIA